MTAEEWRRLVDEDCKWFVNNLWARVTEMILSGEELSAEPKEAVPRTETPTDEIERDGNVQSNVQKIGHKLDNSTIGNKAKMREALVNISKYADCAAMRQHDATTQHYIEQIRKWAEAALAEPRRNCDVGTAGEQVERHREWCGRDIDYSHCCNDCRNCFARWVQMPYEEGGNK